MNTVAILSQSKVLHQHLDQVLIPLNSGRTIHFHLPEELESISAQAAPALLFLDISSSLQAAEELIERIETMPAFSKTGIWLLHPPHYASQTDALLARHAQLHGVLQKPFSPDAVLAAAQATLARRVQPAPSTSAPRAIPLVIEQLEKQSGFIAGVEWNRFSETLGQTGGKSKLLADACQLSMRIMESVCQAQNLGPLASICVFGKEADVAFFSAWPPGGDREDFHVVGIACEPGGDPAEWIARASRLTSEP